MQIEYKIVLGHKRLQINLKQKKQCIHLKVKDIGWMRGRWGEIQL